MVISDINILSVESKKTLEIQNSKLSVIIYDRNKSKRKIYSDKYSDIQKINGIWYQIEPKSRMMGDYACEFFDLVCKENKNIIVFEDIKFKTELMGLIKETIKESPQRKVYFFVDFQGSLTQNKTINYFNFVNLIKKDLLEFNVVYRITDRVHRGRFSVFDNANT